MAGRFRRLDRRAALAVMGAMPLAARSAFAEQVPSGDAPPAFLPGYFSQVMTFDGAPLTKLEAEASPGSASYRTADGSAAVTFLMVTGDDARCDAEFDSRSRALLTMASAPGSAGKVSFADASELRTEARTDKAIVDAAVFRLQNCVLTGTVFRFTAGQAAADGYQGKLRGLVNRWRYEKVAATNPVLFGRWAGPAHAFARQLLAAGDIEKATTVLEQLSTWVPYDLEAKVELAENVRDPKVRTENATVAYERTEDAELRSRAARLIGKKEAESASIPLLGKGESGLQVVLLPLHPCDLTLVSEAAAICRKILDIPVKLRRLPTPWTFPTASRIWSQRTVEAFILRSGDPKADFTGWTRDQYASAMLSIAAKRYPLESYQIEQFVEKLRQEPGQINVGPALYDLQMIIKPYRSDDRRTVFFGVTGAPIYLGTSNYVFVGSLGQASEAVNILSYDMMLAKNAGDAHESRPRVAERLAKELVPATLGALNIEQPSDPSDPGSYADGVSRVDEKSLVLSPPTREAFDRVRRR